MVIFTDKGAQTCASLENQVAGFVQVKMKSLGIAKKLLLTLVLVQVGAIARAEIGFSAVSDEEAQRVYDCYAIPSKQEMAQQLSQLYRSHTNSMRPAVLFNLDGFQIVFNKDQIADLNALTSNGRYVIDHADKTVSPYELSVRKKTRDRDDTDIKYNQSYDLTPFQRSDPQCHTIICATSAIFGETAIEVLWAYKKLGLNLSRFQFVGTTDFSEDELAAIIKAQLSLPKELYPIITSRPVGTGFFKVADRYYPHDAKTDRDNYANAFGRVLRDIDHQDDALRMYTFIHEFGHRSKFVDVVFKTQYISTIDQDHSKEWVGLTGWLADPTDVFDWKTVTFSAPRHLISEYAGTDPEEDFAETFSAYRITPEKLRKVSPERYAFMRDRIFKGVEYTKDICNGSRYGQPLSGAPSGTTR